MTIAIGLSLRNGIVLAADTQESTGGDLKGHRAKIFSVQEGKYERALICGAGDSGHVQALVQELGFISIRNPELQMKVHGDYETPSLEHKFAAYLNNFYKNHIIPFSSLPARDRPDVEMMVAIFRNGYHLFVTEKTAIVPVLHFKAIGIGSTFAELLLGRLFSSDLSISEAEVLAAYVVFLTKESVEGCGKYTTIRSIVGPNAKDILLRGLRKEEPMPVHISNVPREVIYQWEDKFRTTWAEAERRMIWSQIKRATKDGRKIKRPDWYRP